ncbi:RibD family protein [Thiovibrio sp. JS02]
MKVTVIAASTVCGRIGPGLVGGPLDRAFLEKMRSETDASLMGAETLRVWDPEMRGPGGLLPEKRIRAVISRSGDIPVAGKRLFSVGPAPMVFTSAQAAESLAVLLGGRGRVVALPEGPGGLSIAAALDHLSGLGVESLLIEGGGRLNHACFWEGVVDEVLLTIAPKLSGDEAAPLFCVGKSGLGDPFLNLDLLSCEVAESGEIFTRYRVRKEV